MIILRFSSTATAEPKEFTEPVMYLFKKELCEVCFDNCVEFWHPLEIVGATFDHSIGQHVVKRKYSTDVRLVATGSWLSALFLVLNF